MPTYSVRYQPLIGKPQTLKVEAGNKASARSLATLSILGQKILSITKTSDKPKNIRIKIRGIF